MYASGNGHIDIISLLLVKKANVDVINELGKTAIDLAKTTVIRDLLRDHSKVPVDLGSSLLSLARGGDIDGMRDLMTRYKARLSEFINAQDEVSCVQK